MASSPLRGIIMTAKWKLLGNFNNHRFSGNHQTGAQKPRPPRPSAPLGGINNSGTHHVAIFTVLSIEAAIGWLAFHQWAYILPTPAVGDAERRHVPQVSVHHFHRHC